MGLMAAAVLAHGDMVKSLGMLVVGLLLGMVGTDVSSGTKRFGFGYYELADGISVVILAVGLFAIAEIVSNLGDQENRGFFRGTIKHLFPRLDDLKQSAGAIFRGTAIGAFFGVLPGTTPSIAAFSSYMLEKKIAKDPSRFGKGAIEGVAGPESANNADAQCKFIPMLALGIPASGTMALMLGALMIHGIAPGPTMMTRNPELFWGLVASMWIGNLLLVMLNLPLIGLWVSLLKVPYRFLFPAIMAFSVVGIFTTNNSTFDIYLLAIFGIVGVAWRLLECSPVPLVLGLILGPMMEENLRRSLQVSDGDPTVFVTRPLSLAFLVTTALILLVAALPAVRRVTASGDPDT
jgi:TctA family transporter